MIEYEPGYWNVAFAFQLHGSVFNKACCVSFPLAGLSVLLHHLIRTYDIELKMVTSLDKESLGVISGFSFILGFLVVFRSSQAYSRWWEGGTLLQQLRGEWFNSYSCLLAFCNQDQTKRYEVLRFQHQCVRLFSLLYGCALEQVATLDKKEFELIKLDGMSRQQLQFLQDCPDRCEVVLQWIQKLIVEKNSDGTLNIAPPILSRVFNELGNGIVNLNNARKITQYPIPFPLAQMITVMLLIHGVVTPLICAACLDSKSDAFLITFVVISSYWSINYIATELEMPFGQDANDLPLHHMQEDMNTSLRTLIDQHAQRVPSFKFDQEKHEKLEVEVVDFTSTLVSSFDTVMDDPRSSLSVAPVVTPVAPPVAAASSPPAVSRELQMPPPPPDVPPQAILLEAEKDLEETQAPPISVSSATTIQAGSSGGGDPGFPSRQKAANAGGVTYESKRKFLEQDHELIRISTRMEDHLSRIAHEFEVMSRRNNVVKGSDSQDESAWPFFKCTR